MLVFNTNLNNKSHVFYILMLLNYIINLLLIDKNQIVFFSCLSFNPSRECLKINMTLVLWKKKLNILM